MRYEFKIELKSVAHKIRGDSVRIKANDIPPIKRTLVLAHQIADYIRINNLSTLKEFCRYGNISSGRLTQIMKVLLLSPRIQTEILTSNDVRLFNLSEVKLRPLLHEIAWPKQEEMWRSTAR